MDVEAYRKAYEAELSGAEQASETNGAQDRRLRSCLATTFARRTTATAMRSVRTSNRCSATLRNSEAAVPARLAALRELQVARFLGEQFSTPYRADFLQVLREIALPETVSGIARERACTLSAEKDAEAEQRLRNGLTDAKQALVSPLKALQMLSSNDHADIAPLGGRYLSLVRRSADKRSRAAGAFDRPRIAGPVRSG